MRVLRIISSMNPALGGPGQGIRNMIPALEQLGIANEVVCLDDTKANFITKSPFTIHALGEANNPWSYHPQLLPWLKEHLLRFDAVIVHGLWLYHGFAFYKALKILQKEGKLIPKMYVMPHGMLDPWFQRAEGRKLKAIRNWVYWKLIEQKVIHAAEGILFTCEEELRLARETFRPYAPKRELNVGYGIQPPPLRSKEMETAFYQQCPEVQDSPYLLFLSRIHVKKGVDLLIKAYLYLKKEGLTLPKLVVAGPGLETTYGKEMIQLASVDKDIVFPGMLSGDAKWGAFYACEAFVLPSHQENFGIAVVEALACGKIVLISDQVNIWREIEAGKAGIVEPDTYEGMVNLLKRWYKAQKDGVTENAQTTFLQYFSVEEAAKRFENTLNSLNSRPSQDTHTGPSFSLQNRLLRLIWGIAALLFFRYSPRPLHAWRAFCLRIFGAKVGKGVHVYPKVKIWAPWNLELGDECGVGDGATLYSQGKISLGKRVVISQGTHLCAGTHDYTKEGFPLITKPIRIEDNVWVAAEAFVHPGVTIGEGAVVGARSVVTKDMPAWMVCAGHPCKPIKPRVIT